MVSLLDPLLLSPTSDLLGVLDSIGVRLECVLTLAVSIRDIFIFLVLLWMLLAGYFWLSAGLELLIMRLGNKLQLVMGLLLLSSWS